MPSASPPPDAKADYGFDAPEIMKAMIAIGLTMMSVGVALGATFRWHYGPALAWFVGILGAIPLTLGLSMFYYGLAGKFRTRDAMLEFVRWRGDEIVLDVGAGSGLVMIGAAKRLSRGGKAVGVDLWSSKDLSDNSAETTRRNIVIENVGDRTEVHTGNATKLELADASFDHVFSLLCLHNIEPKSEQDQACREIARVLKPGGRAVIGDYVPTGAYAATFRAAGLNVEQSKPAFGVARSLMWLLVADKPRAVGEIG